MDIKLDKEVGRVVVSSSGKTIVDYENYPVGDLCDQLLKWLEVVTEKNASCFIYRNENRSLFGTFRIEPRSAGWQFTSWNELDRANEVLPLEQWKALQHASMKSIT